MAAIAVLLDWEVLTLVDDLVLDSNTTPRAVYTIGILPLLQRTKHETLSAVGRL